MVQQSTASLIQNTAASQPAKNNSLAPKELQPVSRFTLVLISFERLIMLLVFECLLPQGLGEARKVFSSGSSSIQIIISRSEVTGMIRDGQRLKVSFVRKTEKTDKSYHWHITDLLKTSVLHRALCKTNQSHIDCSHLLEACTAHAETAIFIQITDPFRPVPPLC